MIFRLIFLACLAEFLCTKHQQIPQLSLTHTKSPKTSKQTPKHQKQQLFRPKPSTQARLAKNSTQLHQFGENSAFARSFFKIATK